jgi:hypothetical protein
VQGRCIGDTAGPDAAQGCCPLEDQQQLCQQVLGGHHGWADRRCCINIIIQALRSKPARFWLATTEFVVVMVTYMMLVDAPITQSCRLAVQDTGG